MAEHPTLVYNKTDSVFTYDSIASNGVPEQVTFKITDAFTLYKLLDMFFNFTRGLITYINGTPRVFQYFNIKFQREKIKLLQSEAVIEYLKISLDDQFNPSSVSAYYRLENTNPDSYVQLFVAQKQRWLSRGTPITPEVIVTLTQQQIAKLPKFNNSNAGGARKMRKKRQSRRKSLRRKRRSKRQKNSKKRRT